MIRHPSRRLRIGLVLLAGLALGALIIPWWSGGDPNGIADVVARRLVPPLRHDARGVWHLLGTDALGRDVHVRMWLAARVSLGVGLTGALLAGVLGIGLGAVAAWYDGVTDRVIMALSDTLLSIPRLVLLLVAAALWGPGVVMVIVVLALTGWMAVMRLVRVEVARLRRQGFVEAGEALGVPSPRVLWRHVLPNALGSAVVAITLGVANAMLLESGLSFLGLGIQPPAASWGNMIASGREWLLVAPWIALAPGGLLLITVMACTLIGDALTGEQP